MRRCPTLEGGRATIKAHKATTSPMTSPMTPLHVPHCKLLTREGVCQMLGSPHALSTRIRRGKSPRPPSAWASDPSEGKRMYSGVASSARTSG